MYKRQVWDYHHCLNAVRRLEEFAPRLNKVLIEARGRGVTIIHSPSDCMQAYRDHPSRLRAVRAPKASYVPDAVESWCGVIPAEENAVFPIDQSDGGEDDDPQEHAEWVAKLKALGRDPKMPWKKQSDMLTIDPAVDYISDRGDEVWNILENCGIKNVILTGVHTNMCVLGRPFGLRQMARNGKNVVLMRDMTDTMYNPKRWPQVSHFQGTRLIVAHIERFVCPTITSDQLIGGSPFRFASDSGHRESTKGGAESAMDWATVSVPEAGEDGTKPAPGDSSSWYRCVVRIPTRWVQQPIQLKVRDSGAAEAWLNGKALAVNKRTENVLVFTLPRDYIETDDHNLLVVRVTGGGLRRAPVVGSGSNKLALAGQWQYRVDDGRTSHFDMPLPAKFGTAPNIVFTPEDPLWIPRALTRPGEFTAGIEGPACDRQGNVFAVNYADQGTIGRV